MDVDDILLEANKKLGSKKNISKARKGRVHIYASINKALKKAHMGEIFSTKQAGRLYVVTKHKWGKSKQQTSGSKTAKGFTPGSATPGAKWSDVKGYAVRTMAKHGKRKLKSISGGRYARKNQKKKGAK